MVMLLSCIWAGVYVEEGPERDALTAALAKECYVPVYLDPKTVRPLHAAALMINDEGEQCSCVPASCR